MDIDSVLYIVITIVVLVVSGLNSKKKRQAREDTARAAAAKAESEIYEDDPEIQNVATEREFIPLRARMNPLERLEQILEGQIPGPEKQKTGPRMEGKSLEETRDEEELIMEEIRSRREGTKPEPKQRPDTFQNEESGENVLPGLFEDADEIKKAIIYSEILNRKYN